MSLRDVSIVLVGAGNMGGAMLGGWLRDGVSPSQISLLDPAPSDAMGKIIGENNLTHETSADKLSAPDIMIVAVKPQVMGVVLDSAKGLAGPNTVSVSVAAGKTLSFLEEHLGDGAMVRAMPNTPAMVGRGITVACPNENVSAKQKQQISVLLGATGSVEWIDDENLMDAVTAVSGSGPAYAFLLVEAMEDAGIKIGLPKNLARKLALETVAGAGELMMQSELAPSKLRENVTSPGGTTAAALNVLMAQGGFPDLLKEAVSAGAKRSRELS